MRQYGNFTQKTFSSFHLNCKYASFTNVNRKMKKTKNIKQLKFYTLQKIRSCLVPGEGRCSHMLTTQACATDQGMVFRPFSLEQGVEIIGIFIWNRV